MSARVRGNDHRFGLQDIRGAAHAGNSMGFGPSSIAAAATGDAAAAVEWFRGNFTSSMIKPPFNVRTETPDNNTGYFLTASGGFVQNLVFGFTGLRLETDGLDARYPPVLPSDWNSLTLSNVAFRGVHYDIRVARDADGRVVVTRTTH
jgi:trehalose/maltose hydrolase-like predicted phosphorylase